MTATAKTQKTATYAFGDDVTFTNRWGQTNCHAKVIWQDGDTLAIDYLGCQHQITLADLT